MSSLPPPPPPPGTTPPPAAPPPPPAPAPTAAPTAGGLPEPLARAAAAVAPSNWQAIRLTAVTAVAVSGVLAVVLGFLMRPKGLGTSNTVTMIGYLWTSTFGADFTVHGSVFKASASAGIGTFPLGLTIATFLATIWMWRKVSVGYATVRASLTDAAWVALLVAVPMFVVALVSHSSLELASVSDLDGELPPGLSPDAHLGASRAGALFSTFFVVLIVLALVTLARTVLFRGRMAAISGAATAPLQGLGVLVLALPVVGVIEAIVVWLFGNGTAGSGADLSFREWVEVIAGVLAYSGNLGVFGLSLGASGNLGVSGSADGVGSYGASRGLSYFAGSPAHEWGLWISVVLTPLALAVAAYAVLSASKEKRAALRGLGTWVVSLVVVLPVLGRLANLHGHASVKGIGDVVNSFGIGEMLGSVGDLIGNEVHGSGHVGVSLVGTTFLLVVYAAVVSLVVALVFGLLRPDELAAAGRTVAQRVNAARGSLQAAVEAGAGQQPVQQPEYLPGDVVNGYQFDGVQWVPYQGPSGAVPPPPPPPQA